MRKGYLWRIRVFIEAKLQQQKPDQTKINRISRIWFGTGLIWCGTEVGAGAR